MRSFVSITGVDIAPVGKLRKIILDNKIFLNIMMTMKRILFLIICAVLILTANTNASTERELWKGLIGEAVSDGYTGMYAVACVLHNRALRGMPPGLSALKRRDLDRFIARERTYALRTGAGDIVLQAKKAQRIVADGGSDITHGAIYFESIAFPANIKKFDRLYQRTVQIGNHIFYKEKRL